VTPFVIWGGNFCRFIGSPNIFAEIITTSFVFGDIFENFSRKYGIFEKNLCPAKGDLDLSGLVPPTVSAVLNNSLSNIYKIT
jgi:hypothetical protein